MHDKSLLRPEGEAGGAPYVPLPISGISLNPFETNLSLMRGLPLQAGHNPKTPLSGFVNGAGAVPSGCAMPDTSGVPPGSISRTQRCPPLTAPINGHCLGTTVENGIRVPIIIPPESAK